MAELDGAQELADAAAVHAARGRVRAALLGLVHDPLDGAAAQAMRTALGPEHDAARAALRRLPGPCADGAPAPVLLQTVPPALPRRPGRLVRSHHRPTARRHDGPRGDAA